jgi:hypothetical protein
MSKNMFAAKLAAGTRKAKKITTKSAAGTRKAKKITTKSATGTRKAKKIATKSAASTSKSEKIISGTVTKSTSLTELAYQKDLLSPVDLDFFGKKLLGTYLA